MHRQLAWFKRLRHIDKYTRSSSTTPTISETSHNSSNSILNKYPLTSLPYVDDSEASLRLLDKLKDLPQYHPSIKSKSPESKKFRRELHKLRISQLKDPQEKIWEICKNVDWTFTVPAFNSTYQIDKYYQHITNCHLINTLPESYKHSFATEATELKLYLQDKLKFFFDGVNRQHLLKESIDYNRRYRVKSERDIRTDDLTNTIYEAIVSLFSEDFPHLLNSSVIKDSEVHGNWFRGKRRFQVEDRSCRLLSFDAEPLPNPLGFDDEAVLSGSVPNMDYRPLYMDLFSACRQGSIFTGYKPIKQYTSTRRLNGHTQFITGLPDLNGDATVEQQLVAHGNICLHAWTSSLAHYDGFNVNEDLLWPLTCQAIFFDGNHMKFFVYQLNSLGRDLANVSTETRRNILWCSDSYKLFGNGNEFVALDLDCLETLLRIICKTPQPRESTSVVDHRTPFETFGCTSDILIKRQGPRKNRKRKNKRAIVNKLGNWYQPKMRKRFLPELPPNRFGKCIDEAEVQPHQNIQRRLPPSVPKHYQSKVRPFWMYDLGDFEKSPKRLRKEELAAKLKVGNPYALDYVNWRKRQRNQAEHGKHRRKWNIML